MTTLGGDLIRLLAHSGMNVAGNVGTELIKGWMNHPGKLVALKEMFDQMGQTTDPETQQSLAKTAYETAGIQPPMVQKPTVQGYAPPGLEPSAGTPNPLDTLLGSQSSANALKSMTGAVPVTKGETTPEVLKNMIAVRSPGLEAYKTQALEGMAQPQREIGLFPKDATLQAALIKAEGDRALKASEGEANRDVRRDQLRNTQLFQQAMLEIHERNAKNTADRNKTMSKYLSGKTMDANLAKAHTLIGKAFDEYNKIPLTDKEGKVAAANKANKLIEAYQGKYPDEDFDYTRLEPKAPTYWGLGEDKPLPGLAPAAGGAKKPAGQDTVPQPITVRNKRTGAIKTFNTREEADAFLGK